MIIKDNISMLGKWLEYQVSCIFFVQSVDFLSLVQLYLNKLFNKKVLMAHVNFSHSY